MSNYELLNSTPEHLELVTRWLNDANTIEFLMYWEQSNNPSFNLEGYKLIRENIGLNGYILYAEKWIEGTEAIGIQVNSNSIIAAQEITLEFYCWLSPVYKLLVIKSMTNEMDTSLLLSMFYKTYSSN